MLWGTGLPRQGLGLLGPHACAALSISPLNPHPSRTHPSKAPSVPGQVSRLLSQGTSLPPDLLRGGLRRGRRAWGCDEAVRHAEMRIPAGGRDRQAAAGLEVAPLPGCWLTYPSLRACLLPRRPPLRLDRSPRISRRTTGRRGGGCSGGGSSALAGGPRQGSSRSTHTRAKKAFFSTPGSDM